MTKNNEANLKVVMQPFSLLWPDTVCETKTRHRGSAGYIVDANAICEDVFLEGQMHKLRDITDQEASSFRDKFGRQVCASKIKHPQALVAIRVAEEGDVYEPIKVAKQMDENAAKAAISAEADELDIPDPEESDAEWGK